MRVIIAGTRTMKKMSVLEAAIAGANFQITEVVCGGAKGVDSLGSEWAFHHHVDVMTFNVDWSLGRKGGPIRNTKMAEYADALIAVWDGKSRCTKNMIDQARARGRNVYVHFYS